MAETTDKKKRGRPPKNKPENTTEVKTTENKKVKKQRDLNEEIEVKCIVQGGLIYVTSQGFEIIWDEYGDVNYIPYKELIYMANKYKRFFTEPWVIMDEDVLKDLRVIRYYKKIIDYENIDSIFTKTPAQLKKTLQDVSEGTLRLIADRATAKIKDGSLDSLKKIEILQQELKIELI